MIGKRLKLSLVHVNEVQEETRNFLQFRLKNNYLINYNMDWFIKYMVFQIAC